MKAAMAGTLQVLVRIDGTERKEEATVVCCFCNGWWTVAAQNWLAGANLLVVVRGDAAVTT